NARRSNPSNVRSRGSATTISAASRSAGGVRGGSKASIGSGSEQKGLERVGGGRKRRHGRLAIPERGQASGHLRVEAERLLDDLRKLRRVRGREHHDRRLHRPRLFQAAYGFEPHGRVRIGNVPGLLVNTANGMER